MIVFAIECARALALIVLTITVGKMAQYASVDYLEARLGFDLASLIGALPFFAALIYLKRRWPSLYSFRLPALRAYVLNQRRQL